MVFILNFEKGVGLLGPKRPQRTNTHSVGICTHVPVFAVQFGPSGIPLTWKPQLHLWVRAYVCGAGSSLRSTAAFKYAASSCHFSQRLWVDAPEYHNNIIVICASRAASMPAFSFDLVF